MNECKGIIMVIILLLLLLLYYLRNNYCLNDASQSKTINIFCRILSNGSYFQNETIQFTK